MRNLGDAGCYMLTRNAFNLVALDQNRNFIVTIAVVNRVNVVNAPGILMA